MNITIPIEILTPKIPGKQDSVFYHGKNIARTRIRNREYVLTTAGEYCFSYKDKSGRSRTGTEKSPIVKTWNDRRINRLDHACSGEEITNWGWFGINLWVDNRCMNIPTDQYTRYDEALEAFKSFIETDLKGESL